MASAHAHVALCAILTTAAVCNIAVEPAHAEHSMWRQFRPFWGYQGPRHKQPKQKGPSAKEKAAAQQKPPLQVVVSIADQRISVYDGSALIAQSSVSTGVPNHPTPLGVFSVIGKNIWHRSNLYSDAPMPYMQRITWSGIALHAGDLPGYPASHGCIRLEKEFAVRLWHLTKRGTRVIIAPSDIRPTDIASPHLPVFKPKAPPKTLVADATTTDTAVVVQAATPATDLMQGPADIIAAPPAETARKPEAPSPVSVFVSRKSNKLFVRQNFKPLFEMPVTIQNPDQPLGTHVFTLTSAREEGADPRWTVLTVPEGRPHTSQVSSKRHRTPVKEHRSSYKEMPETVAPGSSPEKAGAALGRVSMPPEAMERIAELLVPGSSLILSDQGLSQETGQNTDVIVETR